MTPSIVFLAVTFAGSLAAGQLPDHTAIDPKTLGITPLEARKDPVTGFVVGGKNATDLIAKLPSLAGRSIADLERDMRPGQNSTLGFLGKDEKLLDILAEDNRFIVDKLGLDHQTLARHMRIVGAIARKHATENPYEFLYHGRKLRVTAKIFRAKVESPFQDDASTNCAVTATNVERGTALPYSLLIPDLVERYGFYEGKGTPYRAPPQAILDVFDFIKSAR